MKSEDVINYEELLNFITSKNKHSPIRQRRKKSSAANKLV